jgi:hypothetical protein
MRDAASREIDEFRKDVRSCLALLAQGLERDAYPRRHIGEISDFDRRSAVTFDRPIDDSAPFIEFDGTDFHYVIVERDEEPQQARGAAGDILALVSRRSTFALACNFEARNREPGVDCRRKIFSKPVDYLSRPNAVWARAEAREQDETLSRYPFADNA